MRDTGPFAQFHPLIARWFAGEFAAPTEVQVQSWRRIAAGEHVLITAPTGSGKTFAAFLWAINQLVMRRPPVVPLGKGDNPAVGVPPSKGDDRAMQVPHGKGHNMGSGHTSILYVSPLRALNNDIRRNLLGPLEKLKRSFEQAGEDFPEIRVETR